MVADNDSGKSIKSEARTSSGMFLQKAQVLYFNFFSFLYLRTSFELMPFKVSPLGKIQTYCNSLFKCRVNDSYNLATCCGEYLTVFRVILNA
jgi:hypothetical protein